MLLYVDDRLIASKRKIKVEQMKQDWWSSQDTWHGDSLGQAYREGVSSPRGGVNR